MAANVVIFLTDRTTRINARKASNLRQARKMWTQGDIVDVLPATDFGGAKIENNPKYAIVTVSDGTVAGLQELLEPDVETDTRPKGSTEVLVQRRKYHIRWNTLNTPTKRALENDRRLTITMAQVNSLMKSGRVRLT